MTQCGYLFTILNYIFYCTSRFCRRKYQMLTMDLLAKIAFILGLYFLGSMSGVYSMAVTFFYLICANIKERLNRRWMGLYIFNEALLVYVMIHSFAGLSSVFIFASTSIALLAVWWLPPQQMRIAGLVGNIMTLLYNLSIRNWAGLFELAVIFSNFTSFLKYRHTNISGRDHSDTEPSISRCMACRYSVGENEY